MNKTIIICATALLGFAAFAQGRPGMGRRMRENPDAKLHRFSTTAEKERPQLNDETMAWFTDSRFRGRRRDDGGAGYLPLLGAAKNVSIAYAPVTNEDFARFTGSRSRRGRRNTP